MMNDYMDYFNYISNLNAMPNNSQMINPNQMQTQAQNIIQNQMNSQTNTKGLAEPYIGFTRGNMFDNLYYEYKNYRPQELNPKNNKEYAKLLVQMYGFAAHDLGLYLDVNPTDTNAIRQRAEYIRMYNEALTQYENNYGPITQNSTMLEATPWAWDTKKWPWEGTK